MILWLGVEKFGKIESAKVCINKYTILVGQNNSGKTYLMQLIQGLSGKIANFIDEKIEEVFLCVEEEDRTKYRISKENISQVVNYLNAKLDENKKEIVKDIFGKEIAIEKLYIDVEFDDSTEYIMEIFVPNENNISSLKNTFDIDYPFLSHSFTSLPEEGRMGIYYSTKEESEEKNFEALSISSLKYKYTFFNTFLTCVFECSSLFLPSSRTGLLILYREFFANKTDDAISYKVEGNKIVKENDGYGGLTEPMYGFLRFLQTYSEKEENKKHYENELKFFEDYLIDGHINVDKQGKLSYSSKIDNTEVPMYLASSMINELTPILLAITGERRYQRLIIDEVESSLHPEKQMELVRFFNRLYNKGVELIISTHSDTFVSKVNNLYNVSQIADESISSVLKGVQFEDLIKNDDLYVYEFIIQECGKSIVQEIIPSENGYMFELFTRQALKLYQEAKEIGVAISDKIK